MKRALATCVLPGAKRAAASNPFSGFAYGGAPAAAASAPSGPEMVLWEAPLVAARLLERENRFVARVRLDGQSEGEETRIHVPNTGSMLGVLSPGCELRLSVSDNPKRKYRHSLEWVQVTGPDAAPEEHVWVGTHSAKANSMVRRALKEGWIALHDAPVANIHSEVSFGTLKQKSRVDFIVDHCDGLRTVVEVKSVSLADRVPSAPVDDGRDLALGGGYRRGALFPDCVSKRAHRHVEELTVIAEEGRVRNLPSSLSDPPAGQSRSGEVQAAMLFLIQRGDCHSMSASAALDPGYTRLVDEALAKGVRVLSFGCVLDPEKGQVRLQGAVPYVSRAEGGSKEEGGD